MNRLRYTLINLLLMIAISNTVLADHAGPDTTGADRDLAVLEDFFQNANYLRCSMEWKEGNLGGSLALTSGQCWLRKNKYRINKLALGTMHEIQNEIFDAIVDNKDSTVIVRKPRKASEVFLQISLLDTLFRSAYVSRMYITDTAVSFKMLTVEFKPEAPFTKFKMVYNYDHMLPASISIVRKIEKSNGEIGLRQIEISYYNLSTDIFSEDIFSTDYIFQRQNGIIVLSPLFQQFELLDHTWLP